jgi:hypothetical protein
MRFPHFKSRKRIGSRSIQDEKVFTEASELARRRLEGCIADLQTRLATMEETEDPRGRTVAEETLSIRVQVKSGSAATR